MARRVDILADWYVGSAITIKIPVVDANDAAQNMTGWSLHFEVRVKRTNGEGTAILSLTTPTITLASSGGTNNVAVIPVPVSAFVTTPDERVTYEHGLYRTDGSVTLLAWGDVRLLAAAQNA